MITEMKTLRDIPCLRLAAGNISSNALLFDIETTGFSPKNARVYLIGTLTRKEKDWHLTQWLAQTPAGEADVLAAFCEFASGYDTLIHFNGDAFDLPFLRERCRLSEIPSLPDTPESIDLYRRLGPLKKNLALPAMNLKTLEAFLSFPRKDTMDGGELILLFHQFARTGEEELKKLLLLHNRDDLLGTASLFSLFPYLDFLKGGFVPELPPQIVKEEEAFSLNISLTLHSPVPKPVVIPLKHGTAALDGSQCRISIRGLQGTLKYFFPDYKNYYYLPLEDTAIHKSVAAYVDKAHRVPAKASTCYCKKKGLFLPGNENSQPPLFRTEAKDAAFYQECTAGFLADSVALHTYLLGCLNEVWRK